MWSREEKNILKKQYREEKGLNSSRNGAESGEEAEGRRHLRQEMELEGDRKKRKRGVAETGQRTERRRRRDEGRVSSCGLPDRLTDRDQIKNLIITVRRFIYLFFLIH